MTKNKRSAGNFKKNENKFSDSFKINLFIAEILEFQLALSVHGSVEAYGTYQEGLSQGIPFCEPQQLICLQGGKNPFEPALDHQEAVSGRPKDLRKDK